MACNNRLAVKPRPLTAIFAERMLSSRVLHFAKEQIFWDCSTISACEAMPGGLPQLLDERASVDRHWRERLQHPALSIRPLAGSADDSLERAWKMSVRAYTSCNLTNASDRSGAIWGVAKLVRDALAEDYGEGLFANQFCEQLAWKVANSHDPRLETRNDMFPSWSWMSVNGTVEVADRWQAPRFYEAQNHAGQTLALELDHLQYPDQTGSDDWEHDLSMLDGKLRAAGARHIDSSSRHMPMSAFPERPPKSNPDIPSQLRSSSLAVRCHVGCGVLRRGDDEFWRVDIGSDFGPDVLHLSAFPDSLPRLREMPIHFLILAVSKEPDSYGEDSICSDDEGFEGTDDNLDSDPGGADANGNELDSDNYQDEEQHSGRSGNGGDRGDTRGSICDMGGETPAYDNDRGYSGIGLLVEATEPRRYRRFGALTFRRMPAVGWNAVRLACGERGDVLTREIDPASGQAIFLD